MNIIVNSMLFLDTIVLFFFFFLRRLFIHSKTACYYKVFYGLTE